MKINFINNYPNKVLINQCNKIYKIYINIQCICLLFIDKVYVVHS